MLIKLTHDCKSLASVKSKRKINHYSSCKESIISLASSNLVAQVVVGCQKVNLSKKPQNIQCQVKAPPNLKRQITEESLTIGKSNRKEGPTDYLEKRNKSKGKENLKRQLSAKNLNSDLQSTNVHDYNQLSADQEPHKCHIKISNHLNKQKSIQLSKHLTTSLMCNKDQKGLPIFQKNVEIQLIQKKITPSKDGLKQQITKKINSFKSLSKIHQRQNEYFVTNVGISVGQQKRLQKMQLVEMKILKKEIFELKEKIQAKSCRAK